jgi:hypothetical protein
LNKKSQCGKDTRRVFSRRRVGDNKLEVQISSDTVLENYYSEDSNGNPIHFQIGFSSPMLLPPPPPLPTFLLLSQFFFIIYLARSSSILVEWLNSSAPLKILLHFLYSLPSKRQKVRQPGALNFLK